MRRSITRYPEIEVGAIANRRWGRDRQLVFRYVLGSVDSDGSGVADRKKVKAAAEWLRINPRTRQRLVKRGDATFWTQVSDGRLFLHSFDRIAVALGIIKVRAAFVGHRDDLRGRLQTVRARMAVQALAIIRRGLPVSIATAARLFGTSPRTAQRWFSRGKVKIVRNYALVVPLRPPASPRIYFLLTKEPGLRAVRFRDRVWLARQLPSSLEVGAVRRVRSCARRVNRRLRSRLTGSAPSIDHRAGGNVVLYRRPGGRLAAPPDPSSPHYTYIKSIGKGGARVGLWEPGPEVLG